jgi:hypothetical protein
MVIASAIGCGLAQAFQREIPGVENWGQIRRQSLRRSRMAVRVKLRNQSQSGGVQAAGEHGRDHVGQAPGSSAAQQADEQRDRADRGDIPD